MAAEDLDQESWAVDLTALTWKMKKVMTTFPLHLGHYLWH